MDRIKKLCSYLDLCESFADVGCDHGYCTKYMLERGLCGRATISDISPKSLEKAQRLLAKYIDMGKLASICCDGLEGIDPSTELILIAGMGGEEIISILERSFLPRRFVFQPMKNAPRLRRYLLSIGVHISRDEVFLSGKKFYFVICGERTGERVDYTPAQLEFGRQLQSPTLRKFLREEIEKCRGYLAGATPKSAAEITEKINFMEGVLKGEIV